MLDEAFGYLKRVIVTPAVYQSLDGPRRVDSRSTGQDSHLVRTRWGAEMLCFNYTVGFSWSVAVLNGLAPTARLLPSAASARPGRPGRAAAVSGRRAIGRRPEPPFIPRLQSRVADFPWGRSLLARSCLPRRPDAVIGTARARSAGPRFLGPGGRRGPARWPLRRTRLRRAANASADTRAAKRVESPLARAPGRGAPPSVATTRPPVGS